jgi:hypothetical protein
MDYIRVPHLFYIKKIVLSKDSILAPFDQMSATLLDNSFWRHSWGLGVTASENNISAVHLWLDDEVNQRRLVCRLSSHMGVLGKLIA